MSIGGDSAVQDEQGNNLLKVDGKWLSPTRKKKIYDLEGNLLYTIRNKWFNFIRQSAYVYDENNQKIATVFSKSFKFENRYHIEDCADSIVIEGKAFRSGYQVIKNDQQVAYIKRDSMIIADAFTIDTEDTANAPFYVALAIAMDNIIDERRKS